MGDEGGGIQVLEFGLERRFSQNQTGLGGGEASLEIIEVLLVAGGVAGDGDDSGNEAGVKGGNEGNARFVGVDEECSLGGVGGEVMGDRFGLLQELGVGDGDGVGEFAVFKEDVGGVVGLGLGAVAEEFWDGSHGTVCRKKRSQFQFIIRLARVVCQGAYENCDFEFGFFACHRRGDGGANESAEVAKSMGT